MARYSCKILTHRSQFDQARSFLRHHGNGGGCGLFRWFSGLVYFLGSTRTPWIPPAIPTDVTRPSNSRPRPNPPALIPAAAVVLTFILVKG